VRLVPALAAPAHELVHPVHADNLVTVTCSCGHWSQSWYTGGQYAPTWETVVSAHAAHTAADARKRAALPAGAPLEALAAIAATLADVAARVDAIWATAATAAAPPPPPEPADWLPAYDQQAAA
jgi:hypothetical protein